MKRSDMVSKLTEFLEEKGYLRFGFGGDYLYADDIDARHILKFIEKEGMLPPPHESSSKNIIFRWEEENEL